MGSPASPTGRYGIRWFGDCIEGAVQALDVEQVDLLTHEGGHRLLTRAIRYIEDRRVKERRYTEPIEVHPSPLGVVWGTLDPIAVVAMAHRLVEVRPGPPLVELPDVGHYPMLEAPARFGDAVLHLLDCELEAP